MKRLQGGQPPVTLHDNTAPVFLDGEKGLVREEPEACNALSNGPCLVVFEEVLDDVPWVTAVGVTPQARVPLIEVKPCDLYGACWPVRFGGSHAPCHESKIGYGPSTVTDVNRAPVFSGVRVQAHARVTRESPEGHGPRIGCPKARKSRRIVGVSGYGQTATPGPLVASLTAHPHLHPRCPSASPSRWSCITSSDLLEQSCSLCDPLSSIPVRRCRGKPWDKRRDPRAIDEKTRTPCYVPPLAFLDDVRCEEGTQRRRFWSRLHPVLREVHAEFIELAAPVLPARTRTEEQETAGTAVDVAPCHNVEATIAAP